MSVYTELSRNEIEQLLSRYTLGNYIHHEGISAGVENTNYFVTTDDHQLVLTLFEKHSAEELPFFLKLGEHLHDHHCKVPQPYRDNDGEFLQIIKGKPAVFIERAAGGHVDINARYAEEIAMAMAEVHNATSSFELRQEHSHALPWVLHHAQQLRDSFDDEAQATLDYALALLAKIPADLPSGIIHADMFHDNALFADGHITAIIDWYFAGHDSFALDIAIAMNDWCLDKDAKLDLTRCERFIEAYQRKRALTEQEINALPLLQVQSATRFWLSRALAQQEHGQSNDQITVKDPEQMKQLLQQLLTLTVA